MTFCPLLEGNINLAFSTLILCKGAVKIGYNQQNMFTDTRTLHHFTTIFQLAGFDEKLCIPVRKQDDKYEIRIDSLVKMRVDRRGEEETVYSRGSASLRRSRPVAAS